jgi:hypothetical protein
MLCLLRLLSIFATRISRSRRDLFLENLALRQQLALLKQKRSWRESVLRTIVKGIENNRREKCACQRRSVRFAGSRLCSGVGKRSTASPKPLPQRLPGSGVMLILPREGILARQNTASRTDHRARRGRPEEFCAGWTAPNDSLTSICRNGTISHPEPYHFSSSRSSREVRGVKFISICYGVARTVEKRGRLS